MRSSEQGTPPTLWGSTLADVLYTRGTLAVYTNEITLSTATVKALLVGTGYTADPDHAYVSEVVADELSGSGYERKVLPNKAFVRSLAGNYFAFDNTSNIVFTALDAGTVGGVVIFVERENDTNSILLAYLESTTFPFLTDGTDLELQFHSDGIFKI